MTSESARASRIVIGFDGSSSNDYTAVMGITADGRSFMVGCWVKPTKTDPFDTRATSAAALTGLADTR